MKLEAVITCVNYGDFLAHTLPYNRSLFDKLVVVTAPEDRNTQRVCEYWHVECHTTDAFRSRWKDFCKAEAINEGLAKLSLTDWVLHLDADIVLPPLARRIIEASDLHHLFIYGCDRFMVPSYDAWAQFISSPRLLHENNSWVHMGSFPLGTRVSIAEYGGYIPIGFFQLWNAASEIKSYPTGHKDAARTDMQFALQWPRTLRSMLPELIVYHLESERLPMGANWQGRTSKRFAPAGTQDPAPDGFHIDARNGA
jgi:hypothetical protein